MYPWRPARPCARSLYNLSVQYRRSRTCGDRGAESRTCHTLVTSRVRGSTQLADRLLLRIDETVLDQPRARVHAVAVEPRARRTLAKAVAPRVHVCKTTLAAETTQRLREQHL